MIHGKFMIKRWYKDEKPPAIMSHDEHVCKVIAKDTVHSTPRKGKNVPFG